METLRAVPIPSPAQITSPGKLRAWLNAARASRRVASELRGMGGVNNRQRFETWARELEREARQILEACRLADPVKTTRAPRHITGGVGALAGPAFLPNIEKDDE